MRVEYGAILIQRRECERGADGESGPITSRRWILGFVFHSFLFSVFTVLGIVKIVRICFDRRFRRLFRDTRWGAFQYRKDLRSLPKTVISSTVCL